MLLIEAFSGQVSCPTKEMRQALLEVADIVRTARLLDPLRRDELLVLIDALGRGDLLTVEER